MTDLWLDLETFCDVPLTNGTHIYAERAEITLFAWAIDDGPVGVVDLANGEQLPAPLVKALRDDTVEVWAHNTGFDRTVLRRVMPDLCPPLHRWRDTLVQALSHSMPGGLGPLSDILKLGDQSKDKEGRDLVLLFCKPRPKGSAIRRATKATHPEQWAKFKSYAGRDIEAMRAARGKLPRWNYQGAELALWHLDQKINDRGVCIDMDLAHCAVDAVAKAQKVLAARTYKLTNEQVASATKRDALLKYLLEAFGVDLPDMQKATLERRIEDESLPKELRELLAIRLQASTTSTSKYKTLLKSTSSDGRLRGTLQFNGASRTGRWAGRLFQPQNLPRPALAQDVIDAGIDALKSDCADLIFDNVMELTSSAIRGAIVAPPGKKLVVSDLSNIEGRVAAWLAGESWKLEAFRSFDRGEGHDLYKLAYAKAFGIKPEDVTKDQRQVGKVLELFMQYEGGVGAFLIGAASYNIDLDDMAEKAYPSIPQGILNEARSALAYAKLKKRSTFGLAEKTWIVCDSLKRMWREAHPAIASYWGDLADIVRWCILHPGVTRDCRLLKVRRDGSWLRIRLPSGRYLCYPSPQVDSEKITYMGVHQYTRKWSRLSTYGGKVFENICQAVARDVMAHNMPLIEDAGFEIVLTVHDEVICEAPDTDDFSAERLSQLLSANPPWATDLPLAAGGFETYRYRKD